ncbi:MAG: ABC transporter substrate-binding protein [Desulfobacteraceae bacterium]|nr:ABC transporter substrate-binding protein [Desulfobacteraceae bacterium]
MTLPKAMIVLLLVLCCALPAAMAQAPGPEEQVTRLNQGLLQSMHGGAKLGLQGRYKILAPVIDQTFALPLMARTAAGRFWAEMDPSQQKSYLDKYREWTITSYASNFDAFHNESFSPPELPKPADHIADVVSTFTTQDGKKVVFDYRMVRSGAGWLIADIRVDGVSQLALTRTQFVEVLEKKGVAGLLASIDEKIAKLTGGRAPGQ